MGLYSCDIYVFIYVFINIYLYIIYLCVYKQIKYNNAHSFCVPDGSMDAVTGPASGWEFVTVPVVDCSSSVMKSCDSVKVKGKLSLSTTKLAIPSTFIVYNVSDIRSEQEIVTVVTELLSTSQTSPTPSMLTFCTTTS